MARQKKRRRRSKQTARRSLPEGMKRVELPKKDLQGLLGLLIELSRAAEEKLLAIEVSPDDEEQRNLVMFDFGILLRGSNALKAIGVLCAEAHWEFAVSILRQLFELVLNLEHIARQSDRLEAISRYAKYALLQTVRHQHLDLLYQQKTGREINPNRLEVLEEMLERTFPEFRSVGKEGHVHFAKSWSGHSARDLAVKSKHPLRPDQYELLYASWSEQTHAAPAALLKTLFPHGSSPEEIIAADVVRIVETITMAMTLFLELWLLLPNLPQATPRERRGWVEKMFREARKLGAPVPNIEVRD